jgi:hypothetical protein
MTRESLEEMKALVKQRRQELKESNNPKVLAQQRLIESGLIFENGDPNPIFDSHQYEEIKVAVTGRQLFGEETLVISQPLKGGYIFATIGEDLGKRRVVKGFERVFTQKPAAKKLAATTSLQKVTNKNK